MSEEKVWTPLTLQLLQDNLRRLAERLDWSCEDEILTFDADEVSYLLCDLANGVSGDKLAECMELPDTGCFDEQDEDEGDYDEEDSIEDGY